MKKNVIGCFLLYVLTLSTSVLARDYYVAKSGNNDNPGTEQAPFLTIQKAVDVIAAGDVIYVKNGTYNERVKIFDKKGTPDAYLLLRAYPEHRPVVDGTGVTTHGGWTNAAIEVSNCEYLVIYGFKVGNAQNMGIGVRYSQHVIIKDNITYWSGKSGIHVRYSEHIFVDGNDVSRAVQLGNQECVSLVGVDSFQVKNNYIHNRPQPVPKGGEGLDMKEGCKYGKVFNNRIEGIESKLGLYVDAWAQQSYDIEIFNNIVTRCGAGINVMTENGNASSYARKIKIYNNLSYNNVAGIYFGDNGVGQYHIVDSVFIYSNTIYKNGYIDYRAGGGIDIQNKEATNVVIMNNIVFESKGGQIRLTGSAASSRPTGLVVKNNICFGKVDNMVDPDSNILVDPKVVDAATYNFHLLGDSPAIDSAITDLVSAVDFDGGSRPAGAGYDIGAFEYGAAHSVPASPSHLFISEYTQGRVSLFWSNNAVVECNFMVERSSDGTNFSELAVVDDSLTTYLDRITEEPGKYYYRVVATNQAGNSSYSNVDSVTIDAVSSIQDQGNRPVPDTYQLENYPNPFNPSTKVCYYIPGNNRNKVVKVTVFDILGREAEVLVNQRLTPGWHEINFSPKENLSTGIYFIHLRHGATQMTAKAVYNK